MKIVAIKLPKFLSSIIKFLLERNSTYVLKVWIIKI